MCDRNDYTVTGKTHTRDRRENTVTRRTKLSIYILQLRCFLKNDASTCYKTSLKIKTHQQNYEIFEKFCFL